MGTYKGPKTRLHREFMYLNHDTVLNSLSALEAGRVDEIIQKVNQAREGGLEATIGVGPAKATGGKKKAATIEEELVKTRTWFSAFDSWYRYLSSEGAFGTFDEWGMDVRNAMQVGDTLEFQADLLLLPLHKVFRTFIAYADEAGRQDSALRQKGDQLNETKRIARMMMSWLGGKDKPQHLPMYLRPNGVEEPRIMGRLEEQYVIGGRDRIEGTFSVIAQVDKLLEGEETLSAIRIIRDVPPTQLEVNTIKDAMENMIEPAKDIGVDIDVDDINLRAPAVLMHPIAVFR